ncbi:hypothetical protein [Adhaeribacter pallidiroseus]|uniref:STAS/SEC14 domain-containing protein n=1 Tax=Adhaeribacter pallidiroseus TaxID=2072847 RepID=A0A369Q1L1_9BACT|nr:hypothetical protein [Adhaeribacter pallidiroseus]RDC58773.1 hypothetical protein AHMF7616_05207 [Adhaeribacter pallidiroseus]
MYTSTTRRLYENEVLTIYLELDLSLLRLDWKQQPSSPEYRMGYHQAILLALEYRTLYWLTDSRQVLYLHQADQHWMYAKMRPLLKGGKLQRMAIVLQPETLIMTDQKPLHDNTGNPFPSKKLFHLDFFLDVDSALAWLQENN